MMYLYRIYILGNTIALVNLTCAIRHHQLSSERAHLRCCPLPQHAFRRGTKMTRRMCVLHMSARQTNRTMDHQRLDHQRCVVRRLIALRARRRRTCSENSCHNLSCLDTTRLVLTDIIMVKCLCML